MKSPRFLQSLTLSTRPAYEDVAAALLERLSGVRPAIYTEARTGRSRVTVHLDSRRQLTEVTRRLGAELPGLREFGIPITRRSISSRPLRNRDWAESWKRHFKPIEIGRQLLVRPDWIRRPVRKGQAVVVLNPGLSFGTGHHATTSFCLSELVASRIPDRQQSFLDVGTGSGILAIAASKCGFAPVVAFDLDPESIRVAGLNARKNRVDEAILIRQADLGACPIRSREKYDVICANLTSDLLILHARRLVGRLAKGGRLILAGILRRQFPGVAREFSRQGFSIRRAHTQGEWRSGSFMARGS